MTGKTISHYQILEKLGAGGMGVVYKAHDSKLNRLVALKFLPPHLSANADEKHRFLHEARAASALDHPNIGVVHEIDETPDGQMFIVMAYYQGASLKQKIQSAYGEGETVVEKVASGLPVAEAVEFARQIASGLAKAHEQGIVHRDIKPGNVMVTTDGAARIIDFGLAKLNDATVTIGPTTKGTAGYMSPEQAQGLDVDARSDVWSLGVVLYEMLAGELPFRAQHQAAQVHAILHTDPKPLHEVRPDVPEEVERVVGRAMMRDPARRYRSAAEMAADLATWQARTSAVGLAQVQGGLSRKQAAIWAGAALVVLLAGGAWWWSRNAKVRWAREQALPEIERLAVAGKAMDAFQLLGKAEPYMQGDPVLAKIRSEVIAEFSIDTKPPGALVEVQPYSQPEAPWLLLGPSPVVKARVPRTYLRWRVSKPGSATVQGVRPGWATNPLTVPLDLEGETPPGMVRISGETFTVNVGQVGQLPSVQLDSYLLDKFETTNQQFKQFVDQGGYQKPGFWKQRFVKGGREIARERALAEFRDATGRPGPAGWEAGRFPDGQGDYPVSGVSWYEAAAYAEYAGKSLPTIFHWYHAANVNTAALVTTVSNFSRKGPAPAGKFQGISPNGAFDMAGNVKEWCWTETGDGMRFILGGGWNEPAYMFNDADARSPWDRSPLNGIRLMRHVKPPGEAVLRPQRRVFRDYAKEKPVSDEVFAVIRSLYAYDRRELNPKIEASDATPEWWKREKVSVSAAYGEERVPILLFLPKTGKPPYQVVVYCPGAGALRINSSAEPAGLQHALDVIIKSGRAVAYPVYFGMYERRTPVSGATLSNEQRRESFSKITKDLGRAIDYLETRPDIDSKKLAYMGTSFGASNGVIWSTVEDRIRVCVYQDGGLFFAPRAPEVDPLQFAPRMKKPVLLLSGRYDFTFPLETSSRQLFRLLGAPEKDKRHVIFETAHDVSVMRADFTREVLNWLDKYLGKVE